MEKNRPHGREKFVSGKSATVSKKDEPVNFGGPVGNTHGYSGRTGNNNGGQQKTGPNRAVRAGGGGCGFLVILILAYLLFGRGGGNTSEVLSTVVNEVVNQQTTVATYTATPRPTATPKATKVPTVSNSFAGINSATSADTSVSSAARDKYTTLKGNGSDTVTIMVYMCGTDLESSYGMATNDLNEMLKAGVSDKINLIVETGGCKKWQNSVISSSTNQIYKVQSNGLVRLEEKLGKKRMTDPDTLESFIEYCAENYPADRYALIMWDHGGGSVSGYGYDELYSTSGSMTLDKFGGALKGAGVKFDFIGFDACLMATLETCVTCEPYADYLIASEETEPGVGWYYTDWLKLLSKNTSTDTVTLGKKIVDTFVEVCYQNSSSDKTTLSVVDLAEFSGAVPAALTNFATETVSLVNSNQTSTVTNARAKAREFSSESRLDQVDLIDLATRIGTTQATKLAKALKSVVKYNRTSTSMTNAYGISVYFPYRKTSTVSSAVSLYDAIGMDDAYKNCVESCASLVTAGQASGYATGTTGFGSLLNSLYGSDYSSSSYSGSSSGSYSLDGSSILEAILGSSGYGSYSSSGSSSGSYDVSDILGSLLGNSGLFSGRSLSDVSWMDTETVSNNTEYIENNSLRASDIALTNINGHRVVGLSDEKWALVTDVALNVFYDDGKGGYIDLGVDNTLSYDDDGNLLAEYDGTWLCLDGHIVPYYLIDASEDDDTGAYCYRGYVPALFTGTRTAADTGETVSIENQRVEIMLVFDDETPKGKVAGIRPVYANGETETIAKGGIPIEDGDTFTFVCDYYNKDGTYNASYELNDPWTVNGDVEIENYAVEGGGLIASYRFTDQFNNELWTETF